MNSCGHTSHVIVVDISAELTSTVGTAVRHRTLCSIVVKPLLNKVNELFVLQIIIVFVLYIVL